MCKSIVSVLLLISLLLPAYASAAETTGQQATIQKFQYKSALQASQDAIGQTLVDYRFVNEQGVSVSMASLRGKPLIISMVYSSCYKICPMTIRHLSKVVDKARDTLGEQSFNIAVIGFDTQYDSPQAMKYFAKQQGIDDKNWNILSADPDTIAALSKQLGFQFFTSPNGFDHVVQATVIDAKGEIYRQVYGEVFETQLLVDPLIELVYNRPKPNQTMLDSLLDKVRFFCTSYDPNSDSYHFDYSLFIGMFIGALILLLTAMFITREWRRQKRQSTV
ncbi:MAG: SCO family protein [Gammaproteobacteria bacterium]|nr:SCO family protein [Gammaproteobacteria bacterium]MCW9005603.1 SCO family protein [Gammaproteobacteria bacterium]MCW9056404.1 SCO family protein [Gammaproteobacteria bacterium]